MKKTVFYILLILFSSNILLSNPVIPPYALISEFQFDNDSSWVLEIGFYDWEPYIHSDFDSICISTSYGKYRLYLGNVKDSTCILVFYSDSLKNFPDINSSGDCIKLYSYFSIEYDNIEMIDSLPFGNYPRSLFDSVQSGYSISVIYMPDYFVKDKSPTIGLPNDTIGTCAILKGYMYDKNNSVISEGYFVLEDNRFSFQNDGSYTNLIYSRKHSFKYIYNYDIANTSQEIKINTIELNFEPGCVYEKDIHLLSDYVVKVDEDKPEIDYSIDVINYPNPFNSSTNFYIKIPSTKILNEIKINIYDINGQMIASINSIKNNIIHWDSKGVNGKEISSGTYYYQLLLDNIIYKNGKIVYLK